MYSQQILDRLVNPKNTGIVKKADVSFTLTTPRTTIKLSVKVEDDKVIDAKFKAFGCAVTIAALDVVMDMIKGRDINDIANINEEELVSVLEKIPPQKEQYLTLITDALKGVIKKYNKKKQREESANSGKKVPTIKDAEKEIEDELEKIKKDNQIAEPIKDEMSSNNATDLETNESQSETIDTKVDKTEENIEEIKKSFIEELDNSNSLEDLENLLKNFTKQD